MQFRDRLIYVDALDFSLIEEPYRIFWGDYVLDARSAKSADLKQFSEQFSPWESTSAAGAAQNQLISGSALDDLFQASTGNSIVHGGDGDDVIFGNGGVDFLMGGHGADQLHANGTFFARLKGGDGDDSVFGGDGIEWAHGNTGNDVLRLGKSNDKGYGGVGDDRLFGGSGADWLQGGIGDDYVKGGAGADILKGGMGNDRLIDRKGRDWLDGQEGNDILISRSDQGLPDQKIDTVDKTAQDFDAWSDRLTGGSGADVFKFVYQMNATDEIARQNADANGRVDWAAIMSENDAPHDHWVDWGGFDKIDDFSRAEGDHIKLVGHTVDVDALIYVDTNNDGSADSTMIYLYSNQARMMAMRDNPTNQMMPMAHDRDFLGQILVQNALIDMDDISLDPGSMTAAFTFI